MITFVFMECPVGQKFIVFMECPVGQKFIKI